MPDFIVTVDGQDYDVTAKDENEAWAFANQYVAMRKQRLQGLKEKYAREDAEMLDPTSGMSGWDKTRANFGAGMYDYVLGAKQLFGKGTGADAREKARMDDYLAKRSKFGKTLQFAGNVTPAIAASVLVPGAASIRGGAGIGGAMGLLQPTQDDDIVRGKLINTGVGALTGGVANKILPMVTPYVSGAATKATDALRRLTEGGRQKIAETAFLREVGKAPQALRKLLRARDIPGTLPTTAQQLGQRGMLETERRLSESGGEAAMRLAGQRETSNAARNRFMQQELGADVPALEQAARQAHANNMPQGFAQPFNRAPVLGELTRQINSTSSRKLQALLADIREQVIAAMQSANPVEQLHQIRMASLDDVLTNLAQSDKKLAGMMRPALQSVKKALDIQLDVATNGAWSNYLAKYGAAAGARNQGQAGVELLRKIGQGVPDAQGNPQLTGQRQMLRKEIGATDDAGRSLYGDAGEQTIKDVVESLDVEAQRLLTRPHGSATAANLGRGASSADALLEPVTGPGAVRAAQAAATPSVPAMVVGGGTGGTLGGLVGGAVGGAGGVGIGAILGQWIGSGFKRFSQRNALDVARKLLDLYADPSAAARVLQEAVNAGQVPPNIAQQIMAQMQVAMTGAVSGAQSGTQALSDALRTQQQE